MAGKHSKSFLVSLIDKEKKPKKPRDKKPPMSLPFKIITAIFTVSLLVSSVLICIFFISGKINQSILTESVKIFESTDSETALQMLSAQNPSIKGWLKISGTQINNAVCQGDDNKYYMDHNQQNKKSRFGTLFLSSDDSFNRKGDDSNLVIFGNNMKDGSMFGSLKNYRNVNFYKQNPAIELYYGKEKENYVVFSVMLISNVKDDKGVFSPSKSFFANEQQFDKWYSEACSRSLITTNIKAKYGDDILTLVTVADDFEGARLVVLAKKISNNEAADFDTSAAAVNRNIKYPKIWYDTKGLEYPY